MQQQLYTAPSKLQIYSSSHLTSEVADFYMEDIGVSLSGSIFKLPQGIQLWRFFKGFDYPVNYQEINDTDNIYLIYTFDMFAQIHIKNNIYVNGHFRQGHCGYFNFSPDLCSFNHGEGNYDGIAINIPKQTFLQLFSDNLFLINKINNDEPIVQAFNTKHIQLLAMSLLADLQGNNYSGIKHNTVWLHGQVLSLVSLFIEYLTPQNNLSLNEFIAKPDILRIRDKLLNDLSNPPSLTELAKEANMSVNTLNLQFKRAFGITIYALFQRERMLVAKHRLVHNQESVTTVAIALGYSNLSKFSLAFRQQFGVNPSQLRH